METAIQGDGGVNPSGTLNGALERPHPTVFAREAIAAGFTAAAVLSGVMLRWYHLGGQSLWVDEGQTYFAANLSPANIVRFFAHSSDHPPLYFLLQHYWRILFGNSEYALRALSALFGTFSLPIFYLLAKRVLKDSVAVAFAMWLFAFSMMQVWYSREARAYELTSFLALLGLYALVLFLEKRSAAAFATVVLSATANLYMHNMMVFYLLALNVLWLTYPSGGGRRERIREAFFADVLTGLLYLPWVPTLLAQARMDLVESYYWTPAPTLRTLFGTLRLIAGLNLGYLSALPLRLLPVSPRTAWLLVTGGVSILCAALLAGGWWRVSKVDKERNISLVLYALVPILAVFLLSRRTTSLYVDRVFIDSSAVVPLVLAYPLALQKERRGRVFYGLLGIALAAATALSAVGYLRYQQKDDWRDATRTLLGIPERRRLMVFSPRMGELLFDYYAQRSPAMGQGLAKMALPGSYTETFPPSRRGEIRASDLVPLKLAVDSGKYSEADLVLSNEPRQDPKELISRYLSQVFVHREEQRLAGIRILRFMGAPQ